MKRANNGYRTSKTARDVKHDILISALHKGVRRSNYDLLNGVSADALTYLSAHIEKKTNSNITNFYRRLLITTLEDAPMVPVVFFLLSEIISIFKSMDMSDFEPDVDKMYCYTKQTTKVANLLDSYNKTIVLCPKTRACSSIRLIYRIACNMPPKKSALYCLFKNKYPEVLKSMEKFIKKKNDGDLVIDWKTGDEIVSYCQYLESWYNFDSNKKANKRALMTTILERADKYILDDLSTKFNVIFEDLYSKNEDFMCGLVPMLWIFGHRNDNIDIVPPTSKKTLKGWEDLETYEIPSYVIDQHTSKGKRSGKDKYDFVSEGAKIDTSIESDDFCIKMMNIYEEARVIQEIENEMAETGSKKMKESYIRSSVSKNAVKAIMEAFSESTKSSKSTKNDDDDETEKETESYKYIVRCQLVPSMNKTDVYLAKGFKEWDQKTGLVVVKGPYKDTRQLDLLDETIAWCKENKINIPSSSRRLMCPDRWPKGTPLGVRNNMTNRNTIPKPFLISKFIGDRHNINVVEKTSSKWKEPVEVLGNSLHGEGGMSIIRDWKPLSDNTKFNYILALMAKYVLGIGDWADRNFLFNEDDSVYIIDNDVAARLDSIDFESQLKSKKFGYVMEFLEEGRFDTYLEIVTNWTYFDDGSEARLKRLIKKLKKQKLP